MTITHCRINGMGPTRQAISLGEIPRPALNALEERSKARHAGVVGRPMTQPQGMSWVESRPEWTLLESNLLFTAQTFEWAAMLRASRSAVLDRTGGQLQILRLRGFDASDAGCDRRDSQWEAGSRIRDGSAVLGPIRG